MPGQDGTGPAGRGPLTGRGGGMCILATNAGQRNSLVGFAGQRGTPVTLPRQSSAAAAASRPWFQLTRCRPHCVASPLLPLWLQRLQAQRCRLEKQLAAAHSRLRELARKQKVRTDPGAADNAT